MWVKNKEWLGERIIYFARGSICSKITHSGSSRIHELDTNHEEADTKIAYLIQHIINTNIGEVPTCVVRSSSGDTDIPIILLGAFQQNINIYIDNGTGKDRKFFHLNSCDLDSQSLQALVGYHAFSGNDYVSSFLRKSKVTGWKVVKNDEEFLEGFAKLGTNQSLSEFEINFLQKFVCVLYGEKGSVEVNKARTSIFWKKLKKNKKVSDISLLPPCYTSLFKHSKRANYVARIYRLAGRTTMNLTHVTENGWLKDCTPDWIEKAYPDNLVDLLSNDEEHIEDVEESDLDSDFSSDEE